ncbi:UPF0182 family protein [Leucobacter denitrificans]|uniref:UPF0182 protein H9L06_00395 n=1 Tax=Leucobacter denitrificans TaxID=683042 RepID=A0A7G9S4W8_9MICO|nr:UPF0182 family protein [Leucobacter denitrificans]QNN62893.1 UPF0182 family protein [Leucobacter denitrificans]
MTDQTTAAPRSRRLSPLAITIVLVVVLIIAFLAIASVMTEVLWFEQLGYLEVFAIQWLAAAAMFVIGFLGMSVPTFIAIDIAYRKRPVYARLTAQLDRYQEVIEPLRRLVKWLLPAILGIFAGVASATNWETILLWWNSEPTGEVDAQFGIDLSFYLFTLPLLQSVAGFLSAVVLISLILGVGTSYLYGGISFNEREFRISKATRIQTAILATVYLLIQAGSLWLDQFAALTDTSGFATGAMYTGVHASIPGKQILAGIAAIVALLFLITSITGKWRMPVIGTALLIVSSLVLGVGYPWAIQQFKVLPDEQSVESEYISRNIEATRKAYGLDQVKVEPYDAITDAEPGALRNDAVAASNIRIMDPEVISRTFAQLEQLKQYYKFPNSLNVDRYELDGQVEDTVSAIRDIDLSGQTSWYNRTLVFTHGYGMVAAYGNQRSAGGEPVFLENGIPTSGRLGEFEPRVYFGMDSPEYSIVGGDHEKPIELDYPSDVSSGSEAPADEAEDATPAESEEQATTEADAAEIGDGTAEEVNTGRANLTTFAGEGGPELSNIFTKIIYALKFQDVEVMLSGAVVDGSQILYDRSPLERVQKVAPYLTIDEAPYASVVDGRIKWIIDGYTTSADYPYSEIQDMNSLLVDADNQRTSMLAKPVNYIRNSVKATVDAYDGSVTLYAWDTEDPLLKSWSKVYPGTLKDVSEMSGDLLSHVRYPTDLFKVQREVLSKYHVTNAGAFYSDEDAWRTPDDPVASTSEGTANPPQPPYYLTLSAGANAEPTYSIYSTYIPDATGDTARDILTGYLAANSNAGSEDGKIAEDYGTLKLLTLPKSNTIPAPGQVQNSFNTDPKVSTELNLLRQGGTRVISGNLLTLPVGGGLLYVQPVYLEASSGTQFPLLQKVLVSFGDSIAFEDTLDGALDTLFGGDSGANLEDVEGGEEPGSIAPDDGSEPSGEGEEEPSSSGNSATITQALRDMQEALTDRDAAMQEGDWTAYGEADARLKDALERALGG